MKRTKLSMFTSALALSVSQALAVDVLSKPTANEVSPFALELPVKAPSTDVGAFAQNIEDRLMGKTVGFAYTIAKHGQLVEQGQGGYAQVPLADGAGKAFTVHTDVNVFSVSKPITAIAVLQLLEKLGLHPDDPIADWLPPHWQQGFGFDQNGITFHDLLTHRTGIQQSIGYYKNNLPGYAELSTNTWDGLKELVENGIVNSWAQRTCATKPDGSDVYQPGNPANGGSYFGVRCYKNANYALARLLIWQMALATGDLSANNELGADIVSAAGYQHYVRNQVFDPAGVDGFCYVTGKSDDAALAYDIDQHLYPLMLTRGGSMGGSFPGGLLTCGPKNWWLSAMDLGAIMAHLRYGDLLSATSRDYMDDFKLGWSNSSDSNARPNRYWHGGLGKWTRHNRLQFLHPTHPANPTNSWLPQSVTTRDRVRTCVMKLPNGLDATLVMNSNIRNSSKDACGVLHTAFEESH